MFSPSGFSCLAPRLASGLVLAAVSLPSAAMNLASPAFVENGVIPNEFVFSYGAQCSGQNQSPPLQITDIPAGTRSLAVSVVDPDGGDWLHWLAWNIPVTGTHVSLSRNASAGASFSQARNDFGATGYGGPCPPTPDHRYVFTVYALGAELASQPTLAQLRGSARATATLTGRRSPGDTLAWARPAPQECLLAWAERAYAAFFAPAGAISAVAGPYTYRHYPQTSAYLGVSSADAQLYYLGPLSNQTLLPLGATATWLRAAACD